MFDFALARYNTDGQSDSSFGFAGRVTTTFGTGGAVGYSVAIQPNGNILVAIPAVRSPARTPWDVTVTIPLRP
ncbi:MAG: hypothetical protein IPH05_18895 [Flavobacteriales bacterium]|nr:hypothetical protein [Flavobacteriales bacterium]